MGVASPRSIDDRVCLSAVPDASHIADPMKEMVRKYDAAIVRKGDLSIFSPRPAKGRWRYVEE